MPDALTSRSAVESRHVMKSIAPEGGSYNKAATQAPPRNPAPQFRLFVGEAFMPDALTSRSAVESRHVTKSIGHECLSYKRMCVWVRRGEGWSHALRPHRPITVCFPWRPR